MALLSIQLNYVVVLDNFFFLLSVLVSLKKKKKKKKIEIKMAARIRVSVLEGPFTVLSEVGVPLPVCISMQSKGLQLDKALWTARQSNGGFSVTFFRGVARIF